MSKKQSGISLIAEERKRQIEKEGWTAEHDDFHEPGDLALAGACYAIHAAYGEGIGGDVINKISPWGDDSWWKPKDQLRDLVRAGALIAAEIDKLLRRE